MALNICTSSSPSETLERQKKEPQLFRRLAVRIAVSLLSGLRTHRVTFVCRVFISVVIPRVSSLPYHELKWGGEGFTVSVNPPAPIFSSIQMPAFYVYTVDFAAQKSICSRGPSLQLGPIKTDYVNT